MSRDGDVMVCSTLRSYGKPGYQWVVKVFVNGEAHELAQSMSIAELLAHLGLAGRQVAVERNREIVPRAKHAECALADEDQLEIVTFVGGG